MIHNFGSKEKNDMCFQSQNTAHEHNRFTVSAKLCQNLSSRK